MTLLVDTCVWSLALRRDAPAAAPKVQALQEALAGSDIVVSNGLTLQELLQGFSATKSGAQIVERFSALPMLQPAGTITYRRRRCATPVAEPDCSSARSMP